MSSRRSPRFITWYIAPGYSMRSLRGTEAGCHRRPQVSIVRTDTYSEQAAALGEEAARAQRKSAHLGHGLSSGMGELRTFLIQALGQRGETLGLKDLANRRGALLAGIFDLTLHCLALLSIYEVAFNPILLPGHVDPE